MFIIMLLFFTFVCFVSQVYSARILGIVPTPSYSHQTAFRPLWKALTSRNHQVTLLTTDPINDLTLKNLKEIDMTVSYKKWGEWNWNAKADINHFELWYNFMPLTYEIIDEQLSLPMVQDILRNNTERFDLVMVEGFYQSVVAFSERFNCPLIQMFSLDAYSAYYHVLGNPTNPVTNPDYALPFVAKPNFLERLKSATNVMFMAYLFYYHSVPLHNSLIQRYFGNHYLSVEETFRKTSMLFINTDTVYHTIRPLLPNIIQYGDGSRVTQGKPLPKDLQLQLDNAKDGFIYFSLGSNIKSDMIPEKYRMIFIKTFAELPYTVLWKFETEQLPGKPDNVIISKWFPQQDIFKHPNIKLFISQGGLQSTEEAICNNIPILGIPFIGDQESNIRRLKDKGVALLIDSTKMEKTILKSTILEMINNQSYRNSVKELVKLARDQPMTGIQRAVWWTEYVIRHKDEMPLRGPGMDLPNYQNFFVDVILVGVAILSIGYCLVRFFMMNIFIPQQILL